MLTNTVLLCLAALHLVAIAGLVWVGLSSHRTSRELAAILTSDRDSADHRSSQAVLALASTVSRQSEELTKSTDRVLAAADKVAYQSVMFNESKKPKHLRPERTVAI